MSWSAPQDLFPSRKNGGRGLKSIEFKAALLMRVFAIVLPILVLTACGPSTPPPNAGLGLTAYNTYLDQRAAGVAAASADSAASASATSGAASVGFSTDVISGAIDSAEAGTNDAPLDPMQSGGVQTGNVVPDQPRARGDAPATIQRESGEVDGFVNSGVSDEQDFAAVSSRESIESDAARIEVNRAQYVVVQPGSLPTRPGDVGPNIVEFALATTNPVGVSLYRRSSVSLTGSGRACLKFASPDLAQQALLANGGPESDRKNLDPDGDGFACDWDPTAFRTALR
jgi:hypothetical protein